MNLDELAVTGLTAPAYTLFVDGRSLGDVPAAELENGLNLSKFTNAPMCVQAFSCFTGPPPHGKGAKDPFANPFQRYFGRGKVGIACLRWQATQWSGERNGSNGGTTWRQRSMT